MNNTCFCLGLGLAALVLSFSGAVAAQPTGASATPNSGNLTANTGNSESVNVQAGAVSEVDVSTDSLTQKWAGFFGEVSGNKVLGDGTKNFYQWTSNNFADSKVVAIPSGDTAPSSISSVSDPNSFLGSEFNSGTDSADNTFTKTGDITLTGNTASNTALVETFNSTGSEEFQTYLAENGDASNQPVYIANSTAQQQAFDGSTSVNYQMLVGVGESSDEKAFDFYLELP